MQAGWGAARPSDLPGRHPLETQPAARSAGVKNLEITKPLHMEWWNNLSDQNQEAIIGLAAAVGGISGTLSLRKLYLWLFSARTAPAVQHQSSSSAGSSLENLPLHQIPLPAPAPAGPQDPVQARFDNIQVQVNHLSEIVQDLDRKHHQLQKFAVTRIARLEVKNNRK